MQILCYASEISADIDTVKALVNASPVLNLRYGNWTVSSTLVPDLFALYPPSGRFAPTFITGSGDKVGTIRGWNVVHEAGLTPLAANDAERLRQRILAALDWSRGIVLKTGAGHLQALYFSAFDCPNCRRFEHRLATAGQQLNATLYLFPQTLHANDPDRSALVHTLWCAGKPLLQWRRLVSGEILRPSRNAECGLTNKASTELSDMLGIQGVPALVNKRGRVLQGFVDAPLDQIRSALTK